MNNGIEIISTNGRYNCINLKIEISLIIVKKSSIENNKNSER